MKMKLLAQLEKLLIPIKIEDIDLPTLQYPSQIARNFYQWMQRLINRTGTLVNSTLAEQRKLEITRTYTAYTVARHLAIPFFIVPFPIAISQAAWNLAVWGSISLAHSHVNNHTLKQILHIILQLMRIYDKPWHEVVRLFAATMTRDVRDTYEKKAIFYILMSELSSTVHYHYEKYELVSTYQKKLGITITNPYAEAEKYFLIHKNVPLQEAEIMVFSQTHDNQTHQDLTGLFVSLLAGEEDVILLEGIGSMMSCGDIYFYSVNEFYNVTEPRFSNYQTCFGWDDAEQVNKSLTIMLEIRKSIDTIRELKDFLIKETPRLQHEEYSLTLEEQRIEEISRLVNSINALRTEIEINCAKFKDTLPREQVISACNIDTHDDSYLALQKRREALNEKRNSLMDSRKKVDSSLASLGEARAALQAAKASEDYQDEAKIVKRNKVMISTLQKFSFWKRRRVFIVTGVRHVLRDSDKNISLPIKSDDPQFELREYLDKRPHAILYPSR